VHQAARRAAPPPPPPPPPTDGAPVGRCRARQARRRDRRFCCRVGCGRGRRRRLGAPTLPAGDRPGHARRDQRRVPVGAHAPAATSTVAGDDWALAAHTAGGCRPCGGGCACGRGRRRGPAGRWPPPRSRRRVAGGAVRGKRGATRGWMATRNATRCRQRPGVIGPRAHARVGAAKPVEARHGPARLGFRSLGSGAGRLDGDAGARLNGWRARRRAVRRRARGRWPPARPRWQWGGGDPTRAAAASATGSWARVRRCARFWWHRSTQNRQLNGSSRLPRGGPFGPRACGSRPRGDPSAAGTRPSPWRSRSWLPPPPRPPLALLPPPDRALPSNARAPLVSSGV